MSVEVSEGYINSLLMSSNDNGLGELVAQPPEKKKRKHKITEQKGRQKINDQINELKLMLPECRYVTTTKASVLECTVNSMKRLQAAGTQLMVANKKLQTENVILRTELEKYVPHDSISMLLSYQSSSDGTTEEATASVSAASVITVEGRRNSVDLTASTAEVSVHHSLKSTLPGVVSELVQAEQFTTEFAHFPIRRNKNIEEEVIASSRAPVKEEIAVSTENVDLCNNFLQNNTHFPAANQQHPNPTSALGSYMHMNSMFGSNDVLNYSNGSQSPDSSPLSSDGTSPLSSPANSTPDTQLPEQHNRSPQSLSPRSQLYSNQQTQQAQQYLLHQQQQHQQQQQQFSQFFNAQQSQIMPNMMMPAATYQPITTPQLQRISGNDLSATHFDSMMMSSAAMNQADENAALNNASMLHPSLINNLNLFQGINSQNAMAVAEALCATYKINPMTLPRHDATMMVNLRMQHGYPTPNSNVPYYNPSPSVMPMNSMPMVSTIPDQDVPNPYKVSKRKLFLMLLIIVPMFLSFDSVPSAVGSAGTIVSGVTRGVLGFDIRAPVEVLSTLHYFDMLRVTVYCILGVLGIRWTANSLFWATNLQNSFSFGKV